MSVHFCIGVLAFLTLIVAQWAAIINPSQSSFHKAEKMKKLGYFPNESKTKYYKLHLDPQTWYDGYEICRKEGAYLAIINSDAEAKLFVTEFAKHPASILPHTFHREVLNLGFYRESLSDDFVTIKGTPLSETGYTKWGHGQPDNDRGNERCGSMLRDGKLNDFQCKMPVMFMCEYDV